MSGEGQMKRSYRRKGGGGARGVLLREEAVVEEDKPLLEERVWGRKILSRVKTIRSESELLHWILEETPEQLGFGEEHYLLEEELQERWRGLSEKLEVNGWEDRGRRLGYLWEVLRAQFANKRSTFKIITQFLMLMAQRPTAVTNLDVKQDESYSMEPEEEIEEEDDSEKQRQLLKEILGVEAAEAANYSSGDSLSEWTESEEEEVSVKSGNDLPPITRPVRTSSSFGEFKDILQNKTEDAEQRRKEAERFWKEQQEESKEWLEDNIRMFEMTPLQNQPVISSRLVLQARFGEWWEWRKQTSGNVLQVAFCEDVIREVLWQFSVTEPKHSSIFREDWTVRKNIMVASLSKNTLDSVLVKFGKTLAKFQVLRRFYTAVLSACNQSSDTLTKLPPSKCFRSYASGIEEISIFIMKHIAKLEGEMKRSPKSNHHGSRETSGIPAVTTFIQLERQTKEIQEMIEVIYKMHSQAMTAPSSAVTSDGGGGDGDMENSVLPWEASMKLLACLETHLIQEVRPSSHGLLLFLWTKCLEGTFEEILCCVQTLKWDQRYSLFIRDPTVRLNDANFWSECIKIRDLSSFGKNSLLNISKLLPKMLSILKTCEVFDQLEEEFTQILGTASSISAHGLIRAYLQEIMPPTPKSSKTGDPNEPKPDYFAHFQALGLNDSMAIHCFRFLQYTPVMKSTRVSSNHLDEMFCFPSFWRLEKVPVKLHSVVLDGVLAAHFDPFCESANQRITQIFQDYYLLEKMTTFQEIILTVREDFARGIMKLTSEVLAAKKAGMPIEDPWARNAAFQKLLNDCYPPECRGDTFSIDLKLDVTCTTDMLYTFEITPQFPLNLIVTPQSVAGYLFIGRQMHRIRKALWNVNSLSPKFCCSGASKSVGPMERHRMQIMRFCLINFCATLRSFFMLKVFSRDFADYSGDSTDGELQTDLDVIRGLHEKYLNAIQTQMLRDRTIDGVLIPNLSNISEKLRISWNTGLSLQTLILMEDKLKKLWQLVNGFENPTFLPDFHDLASHFGRPPCYLGNL